MVASGPIDGIRASLADAATRLAAAGARDEALATFVPEHRVMLVRRKATMLPLGRVWRLGVLLLDADGRLYATGSTTRALEPGRRAYQSQSAELRREYRGAAFRGPFERGETVNFDAAPIELQDDGLRESQGPLVLRGEEAMVRWDQSSPDALALLDEYLADRVRLLVDPPEGA
jgi:hypothetical protein